MIQQTPSPRLNLPQPLRQDQVEFYIENGYLIVTDLVSRAEVEEMRRDIVLVARGKYDAPNIKPLPDTMSDEEALQNILCIHQPHYVSQTMTKYVKHPTICGILSQITGAHLPHWDGSVKCMQSMFFVKPPGFQGQAWHQDELYIPTRDRSLIGAWIALDDATLENGCLHVVPKSHQSGYLFPQKGHDNPDEFDFAPESYGFEGSAAIPVEVKAGTVVFFNGYLLHRSFKNRSSIYRRVLVSHYMNAWSFLPWHLAPNETPASADVRTVVHVAGIDPYAWKGYDNPPKHLHLRTCKANKPEKS